MNYRYLAGALALSAAIATAACGDDPPPTQPTPAPTPPPVVNPVLTAPTVDSPAEDAQLSTLRPTLVVRKATSDQAGPRSYEFQVSDDPDFQPASASNVARHYRLVAAQAGIAEGPNDATFTVAADLQPATRFYWRARARQGTVDGPWSARSTFRTRVAAYNVPGELYDPLTTGTTVGQVVGSVTLTPGRGATINSNESHIRYQLPQTVIAGEFSMEVDGIQNFTPGDKTKIMSMYDGNGDITTSDYRMTVEKRDAGIIAWRFIAGETDNHETQIETIGAERTSDQLQPGADLPLALELWARLLPRRDLPRQHDRRPDLRVRQALPRHLRSDAARGLPRLADRPRRSRTTRRWSARPGATSTWARPPGRVRPRWARRSSRIRTRIRASRTAASAPPTSRAPRHELEAPAPSRGPALFLSGGGLTEWLKAHRRAAAGLPGPCARRRPPATPANGPRGG